MTLIERIQQAIALDDSDDSVLLQRLYEDAAAGGRGILDAAMVCLCGWSMKTLLEQQQRSAKHD